MILSSAILRRDDDDDEGPDLQTVLVPLHSSGVSPPRCRKGRVQTGSFHQWDGCLTGARSDTNLNRARTAGLETYSHCSVGHLSIPRRKMALLLWK